ncbi:MAG TPA: FecR domain-containing protein, partial [Planctomycetota bacterium]|nr:FecR domain-containing protein [Planctomycetota bacterium]
MSIPELLDAWLAGELSPEEEAAFEQALADDPALLRELVEQRLMDNALRVMQGDPTADQAVAVSVLGVLNGKSIDAFKTDLLKKIQAEAAQRKDEEAAARVPVEEEPADAEVLPPPPPVARRRPWRVLAAVGLAAAALFAAALSFVAPGDPAPAAGDGAFLLAAGPGATLARDGRTQPARADLPLRPGDRLALPEGVEARIAFADDTTRLDLAGPAELHFLRGGRAKRVELLRGQVMASVPKQESDFAVLAPHGEARIGEALARIETGVSVMRLDVRRGSAVLARRDGRSVRVAADHYALAGRDVELAARPLETDKPAADGPAAVAVLKQVQGEVFTFQKSPADRVPAKAGQGVLPGQSLLVAGAGGGAVVEFPDQTRLELGGETILRRLVDETDPARKTVVVERGTLAADVTRQPAGKPMTVRAKAAEVEVLGTRFVLSADAGAARLQVEEGLVTFRRSGDRKEIQVRSGFQAAVAPGTPFEAVPVPGGAQYLHVDFSSGSTEGDGVWVVDGRVVRQRRLPRQASTRLFRAESEEGVVLEATAEVGQVAAEAPGAPWGFGLAAVFRDRRVVLRSQQNTPGGSHFEFKDVTAIPFEHGREGVYRLKLRIERREGGRAVLRGKIWQGDREPDGWMIEDEL